ncbi:hypothetical protein BJ944DRAFT_264277 [Cunninghamella echinulata]|nr:hypothetical protein BJ944DRAFT_264277 [Cunninghamella echinulata]
MNSVPLEGSTVSNNNNNKASTIIGLSMNKHGFSMNNNNKIQKQQALPPLNLKNTTTSTTATITLPLRKHSLDSKLIDSTSNSNNTTTITTPYSSSTLSSCNSTPSDIDNSVVIHLIPSCRTILFISELLQQTIDRCIHYSNNNKNNNNSNNDHISPISSLIPLVNQLRRISDALDVSISRSISSSSSRATTNHHPHHINDNSMVSSPSTILPTLDTLLPLLTHCLDNMKDICIHIQSLLNIIVQVLDTKHTRHLLLTIHGVTMDMKDAWETIISIVSSHSSALASSSLLDSNNNNNNDNSNNQLFNSSSYHPPPPIPPSSSQQSHHQVRSRSHSDHTSSSNQHQHPFLASPTSTSFTDHHSNLLYTQLKTSVSASVHLIDVLSQSIGALLLGKEIDCLSQSIETTFLEKEGNAHQSTSLPDTTTTTASSSVPSFQQKLLNLQQQVNDAIKCTNRLNSHLDLIKDLGFEQYASIVQLWEDTNEFSKTFISLLNRIKLLSMEEDVHWSKAIKQGCLHVTRVTAEVAKLWNNYPMFIQEGYILGKTGDHDSSLSSTTTTITTNMQNK